MNRDKTVSVSLAVLMLLSLTNPALATPVSNTTTTQTTASTAQPNMDEPSDTSTLEPDIDQVLTEADTALQENQVSKIRQELDAFGDELEGLNTDYLAETTKLAAIQATLDETQDRLRWYQAEHDAQRTVLENRIADIYKHGKVEPVDAIINNNSFSEAFTKLSLLIRIGEQDVKLLRGLRDQKQKVEDEKVELDRLYAQQKDITAGLEGKKKAIEEKMQQETVILANLDTRTRDLLAKLEAQQQEEQTSIIDELTESETSTISLKPGSVGFEALKYLGIPYVWGGETPKIGLDCSGLVKIVFKKFGVDLPHYSRAQAKLGAAVGYDELQPGDLVFFGQPIHHVGIYLGDGYYIHAPKRNDVVKISRMDDRSDHAGARRIISMISQF